MMLSKKAISLIYAVFVLQGIGSMLSWNVFITADDYFREKFINTPFEETFLSWFGIIFNITALTTMLVRTFICSSDSISPSRSVWFSLIVITLVISVHIFFTKMPQFHGINFFYCTVTSIVIVSIACTMMQDGLFRITANFPSIFTQGIISGQALAGLIISIGNFCIVLFKHENIIKSSVFLKLLLNDVDFCAFVYFAGAMMMLLLCVITFWMLQKQKSLLLELFWMQRSKQNPMKETTISERFLNDELASRENLLGVEKAMEELEAQSETGLLHIVYKIRYFAMSVFMVFFVSLGAFPAITSMIHSMHPTKGRFFQELFIPFTFVLWNAGDFVGRQASSCCNRWSGSNLVVASVTRLAFFPLFMFCNLQNDHGQTLSHVLFRNDVFPFVFIFLCAFTNGFLCTMAMMEYPTVLRTKKQKEMGGTLMFCVISIGLTSGSLMSFVLEALLQA